MMTKLLSWLDWRDTSRELNPIDCFLAGASIPALSAAAGQDMIARQRQIEAEIRAYIYQLEREITDLHEEMHACNPAKR